MRISDDVLEVIAAASVDGNKLFLTGQLDRNLYVKVDKVLKAAGGQWNRKEKAHVFDRDAEERIQQIIETGDVIVPQDFDYFPTPEHVARGMANVANLQAGMLVLEPSAGQGAIVEVLLDKCPFLMVDMYELQPANCEAIFKKNFKLSGGGVYATDFMTVAPVPIYDRVVMNPPFSRQADIDHVLHAYKFLKPGGRLISVMSASVSFRQNKKTESFRAWLTEKGGTIEPLPEGAFKESGTMVRTVVIVVDAEQAG